VNKLDNF